MPFLNIYSLDDTEYENVIACLSEGKHVIGRGDLLKVSDKRVSRKHAVIEVSSNKISLTSVHVNPCFFKAANGKTLTVLSSNQESELNDGDQFALLPESCWFRVKIKWEHEQNKQANGNTYTLEINGKRYHDNDITDTNSDSKRTRLSTSHGEIMNTSENNATTSNITLELLSSTTQNDQTSDGQQDNVERTSQYLAVNDENYDFSREIKEEPTENEISFSLSTALHNLNDNGTSNTLNTEIKQEINEDVPGDNGNENNNPTDAADTSQNNEQFQIQTERDDQNHENESGCDNSHTTKNNEQPVIKTENDIQTQDRTVESSNDQTSQNNDRPVIKTENDNQNQDNASGSGNGPRGERRERCWYGSQCFRKNPTHRESFSHPGDQDYDSDPSDDRPNCPYGASCYRKNIEHRRQYKHVGKPAPKPRPRSTSPTSPHSPSSSNQKKPRKAATKKPKPKYDDETPEDDYDLDDPFINDGSSDDFQPSDVGSASDSSSEWVDSQEVDEETQETKRMLKEAKKFTRKKKKD